MSFQVRIEETVQEQELIRETVETKYVTFEEPAELLKHEEKLERKAIEDQMETEKIEDQKKADAKDEKEPSVEDDNENTGSVQLPLTQTKNLPFYINCGLKVSTKNFEIFAGKKVHSQTFLIFTVFFNAILLSISMAYLVLETELSILTYPLFAFWAAVLLLTASLVVGLSTKNHKWLKPMYFITLISHYLLYAAAVFFGCETVFYALVALFGSNAPTVDNYDQVEHHNAQILSTEFQSLNIISACAGYILYRVMKVTVDALVKCGNYYETLKKTQKVHMVMDTPVLEMNEIEALQKTAQMNYVSE